MKKSDLFQIFINLSPEDRRALRKFVHSPFFNKREDVILLFQHFDHYIEKDLSQLSKEKGHAAAYPNLPFDDQRIRYCMSFLLKTIEQYIIHRQATNNQVTTQLHLANAYRHMGLGKLTGRSIKKAKSLQERNKFQNADFYEMQYRLEEEELEFSQTQKRTAARNLQQVNHSLDLSYLAKKLRQSCIAIVHGTVANVEYDSGLLNLLLGYLETVPWLDEHPAIGLYFYFYQAASIGDEQYFKKLKNGMKAASTILPEEELRSLHFLAINFCIQQFNKGEEQYLVEVFDLYKNGLEQEILLIQGQLSRFAFTNIAGIAIRLGEFDWTEEFIKKYTPTLELLHRRNYRDFIMAKLHYARRDLDQAQLLLQNVEYEDVFLNLDAKVLLLKIYFENDELNVLDSFIHSFQRFLKRKKGLGYHRDNYLKTLQFAQRLLSLNPFDKNEKKALKKDIEEAKGLGEKDWFLGRLGK